MRLLIMIAELLAKLSLILCGLLSLSSPAIGASCYSDCSAMEFGIGVSGGSAFTIIKSDSGNYRARGGVVTGSSELDIGYSPDSSRGLFGAMSFQSIGMESQYADDADSSETRGRWNGGGIGAKFGVRYGALSGWAGGSFGILSQTDTHVRRSYFGPAAGIGVSLYRSTNMRIELQGTTQGMKFGSEAPDDEVVLGSTMYRQQIGLQFNYLLNDDQQNNSSRGDSYNLYFLNWSGGNLQGAGYVLNVLGSVGVEAGILLSRSAISLIQLGR